MSETRVRVTDRRMFTLDGELRDEYRHLEDETADSRAAEAETKTPPPAAAPAPPAAEPAAPKAPPEAPRVEGYPDRPSAAPGFLDLVGMLAEPASIYLREASAGDADTMADSARKDQNLEFARLHIDLLEVLQQKTAGNLDTREQAFVDDVIYRLRLAYVQTQG